jgi:hypothetical protein
MALLMDCMMALLREATEIIDKYTGSAWPSSIAAWMGGSMQGAML